MSAFEVVALEVDSQRKLNLSVCTQPNSPLNCTIHYTEGTARQSAGERLPRLQSHRSPGRIRTRELSRWVRKVGYVEDVEHLGAEFDVRRFRNRKLLRNNHILLHESRSVELISHEIAE